MRAFQWRTKMMGPVERWHELRAPVEFDPSAYDTQIRMDVARTHSSDKWFDPHRESICKVLNAFANTNIGFGYPQGLNFLVFPLWKVYYTSIPEWAMHDVYYSLQFLVGELLSVYPVDKSDGAALDQIRTICAVVKLRSATKYPDLRKKIFSEEYDPLITSLVSRLVPTLFANVYAVDDCLVLWDGLLSKGSKGSILDAVIQCMVTLVCLHRNVFEHLSLESCMVVVQESVPLTLNVLSNSGYM